MQESPKRKDIRLKDYDYSQNGAYFITICVKNRFELLGRIVGDAHLGVPIVKLSDKGKMVEHFIDKINNIYNELRVENYIIMPNHIHFILSVTGGRDARCASPTKTAVAKTINALKSLTSRQFGESIWQRSYHDHIIRSEDEYNRIFKYIDDNPAKWTEDEYNT